MSNFNYKIGEELYYKDTGELAGNFLKRAPSIYNDHKKDIVIISSITGKYKVSFNPEEVYSKREVIKEML